MSHQAARIRRLQRGRQYAVLARRLHIHVVQGDMPEEVAAIVIKAEKLLQQASERLMQP